jgi:hypothetical protein
MSKKIGKIKQTLIARSILYGFSWLLEKVVDMEKRGVSEEVHQGELRGKTKDGKDIKMKYGYDIKVGLDDFVKKLKEENSGHGIDRTSE